ncbi:hypothetical protein PNOK_0093200 [Pyrrhoderma noxium]|uniref:Uncharacterized protein n=1 Tax=Pyrrhoderma noxium TaxID=2282107 RepID=A0A286UWF5_9AGAM|nr:hypothetical protein PNOK_0093200 [Pyrrhoderma noxium]
MSASPSGGQAIIPHRVATQGNTIIIPDYDNAQSYEEFIRKKLEDPDVKNRTFWKKCLNFCESPGATAKECKDHIEKLRTRYKSNKPAESSGKGKETAQKKHAADGKKRSEVTPGEGSNQKPTNQTTITRTREPLQSYSRGAKADEITARIIADREANSKRKAESREKKRKETSEAPSQESNASQSHTKVQEPQWLVVSGNPSQANLDPDKKRRKPREKTRVQSSSTHPGAKP